MQRRFITWVFAGFNTGRSREATGYFEKALAINPGHSLPSTNCPTCLSRKADTPRPSLTSRSSPAPEYQSKAHLGLGHIYFARQEYSEAVAELEKCTDSADTFDVSYYLGRCYLEMEKPDVAQTHFERALKLRPGSAELYYRLGMAQFQKRDNIQATHLLLQALKIDPGLPTQWALFGSVCLLEKANSDAIRAFQKCSILRPESSKYLLLLGSAYLEDREATRGVCAV